MTHPHDFALLNDLLDGRMGWSATEELRRRLVEEPELGSAYDELVRLRAGLGALPRRAPPADFLAGVRARAGLAPAVEAPAAATSVSAPPSDSGVAGSAPISSREAPAGGGRVLRFPRRFLPLSAAAGLLVGLGAFALFGMRDRMPASAPTQSAGDRASPTAAPEEAKDSAGRPGTWKKVGAPAKPGAPPPTGTGVAPRAEEALDAGLPEGARPHYGAPGGAVVPGLRAPTDDPAGAAPPRPAPGLAGTEMAPARDEASRAGVGGGGGGGARTGELAADAAAGAKAEAERARPVGGPAEGKLRGLESALAWARPGADEVLVVHAADFDGARADVALLLAAVRSGSSVEGRWKAAAQSGGYLLREAAEPPEPNAPDAPAQPALDDDAAKEDGLVGRGASAPMPEDAKRKAASAPPPLGTFVVEVTEEEWTRLAGALGSGRDVPSELDSAEAYAPPAPAAPPTPATRPAPVAPPLVPPSAPTVAPPVAVPPAGPPPPPTPTPAPPPEPAPLPDVPIPPPAAGAAPPTEAEAPAPSATGGMPRTTAEASKDADKAPPADRRSEPRRRVRIVVLPR